MSGSQDLTLLERYPAPNEDGYLGARNISLYMFSYMLVSLLYTGCCLSQLVCSAFSIEPGAAGDEQDVFGE